MRKHLLVLAAAILTGWALPGNASSATPSLAAQVTTLAKKGGVDAKAVIDPEKGTEIKWPVLIPDREPDFKWVTMRVTREKLDATWAKRITGLLKLCAHRDFTLACQAKSMTCTLEAPSGAGADLKVVERKGLLYFSRISGIPPE